MNIGKLLTKKDKRDLLGYSQDYMALKLNISQATYNKIEKGTKVLSAELFYKIVNVLNLSDEEIDECKEKNNHIL